jgi:hypothetical protein
MVDNAENTSISASGVANMGVTTEIVKILILTRVLDSAMPADRHLRGYRDDEHRRLAGKSGR